MGWIPLRAFLGIPAALTGKGIRIAVVDGDFPAHPDIASSGSRTTLLVYASDADPRPVRLEAGIGPWPTGPHALWAAAAAAGSGARSGGFYDGAAPEAELVLVAGWSRGRERSPQVEQSNALRWVRDHGREFGVRGVLAAIAGEYDAGLLPWQADPLRVLCEEIADVGLLVVAGVGNQTDRACMVTQAAAPSCFAVGGVVIPTKGDAGRAAPHHSCRGTTFEGKWVPNILAPAENLVLPWGDEAAMRDHAYAGLDVLPTGYARQEGTSFAGPIALGAAACVWQSHPEWSAQQVKAALLSTVSHRPQWAPLGAGLFSVSAAVGAMPVDDGREVEAYRRWRTWRRRPVEERLQAVHAVTPTTSLDALLSFLPEGLPPEADTVIRPLLDHPDFRLRTGALTVLTATGNAPTARQLIALLGDDSANVRFAALCCLSRHPAHWPEAPSALLDRFADPCFDVRESAFRLAGRIGAPCFVAPLVAGLAGDTREGRIANFGARRDALRAITGREFPPHPPWQPGGCPYSERTHRARLGVATRWNAWLDARDTER